LLGKKQIYKIARHDPLSLFIALKLLKNPSALKDLLNGDSENLPTDFYIIGRKLLIKYSEIVYKKYSNSKLDEEVLKEIINEDHGTNFIQKKLVKWDTTLYILIRLIKPKLIVETGVLWGYSSAHILKALEENNSGFLYSIDLTDSRLLSRGLTSGPVVPDNLKGRWELIIGKSIDKLPDLLKKLESIDIFIHDSEHSYENMMFEYETAYESLNEGGLLISHDIEANTSFIDFCSVNNLSCFIYEDDSIGIVIKK